MWLDDVSLESGYLDLKSGIVGLATPMGKSALAVVRISGGPVSHLKKKWQIDVGHKQIKRISLTDLEGNILDDAVVINWEGPKTPTGEDLLELMIHGSEKVIQDVLKALYCWPGLRSALPGEFTFRGLINGKTEEVKVLELVQLFDTKAISEKSALEFSTEVDKFRKTFQDILLKLEASIDFDEQGINLTSPESFSKEFKTWLDRFHEFVRTLKATRERVVDPHIVLIGRPNVGKSSILNKIAGSEVAIVTEEPGTTRDLVRMSRWVGGTRYNFLDSAGWREGASEIERLGIEKSKAAAEKYFPICIVDGKRFETWDPTFENAPVLINKSELLSIEEKQRWEGLFAGQKRPFAFVSAVTESGEVIIQKIQGWISAVPGLVAPFEWQQRILESAGKLGEEVLISPAVRRSEWDLVVSEMRSVERRIAMIFGEFDRDVMLQEIFSKMCIGK